MGNDGRKACNDKPDVLLNELGSLQEILGEAPEQGGPHISLDQISSVEEYLRIKQLAAIQGVSVEQYLSQNITTDSSGEKSHAADEDRQAPATVDAYFRSVAANKKRTTSQTTPPSPPTDNVPVLSEVASASDAGSGITLSAHEMHQLVELIVNRKLQEIKGILKEEVLNELQKLLPPAGQDKR